MDEFLTTVRDSMVKRGWGHASAEAEIRFDPTYLHELHIEGMSAADVASEVIRQADNRQFAIN